MEFCSPLQCFDISLFGFCCSITKWLPILAGLCEFSTYKQNVFWNERPYVKGGQLTVHVLLVVQETCCKWYVARKPGVLHQSRYQKEGKKLGLDAAVRRGDRCHRQETGQPLPGMEAITKFRGLDPCTPHKTTMVAGPRKG